MRDIVRGKHCLQHEVEHAEEESDHDIDDGSLDECALLYEGDLENTYAEWMSVNIFYEPELLTTMITVMMMEEVEKIIWIVAMGVKDIGMMALGIMGVVTNLVVII